MRAVPTLRTARLTLRVMRPQDFERYAEIRAAPAAAESQEPAPIDRAGAWRAFLRNAGHWQMTGFGLWAIEPHGAGTMMGQVGFLAREPGADATAPSWPDACWALHPSAEGTGLAQEAAAAAHDWFDRVVTGPLLCRFPRACAPAEALAQALGYLPMDAPAGAADDPDLCILYRKGPPGGPRNLLDESNLW